MAICAADSLIRTVLGRNMNVNMNNPRTLAQVADRIDGRIERLKLAIQQEAKKGKKGKGPGENRYSELQREVRMHQETLKQIFKGVEKWQQ